MGVKLAAASGGSIELVPTNTASAFTVTVPAVTATVLTDSAGILNIGSGQIYKDASGNVGIGTTSPAAKFQVEQNQAALSYLLDTINSTNGGSTVWRMIMRNIANSGTTSVDFYKPTASGFSIINNDTNASNYTAFAVGSSERMRIDSSGNLLIGYTSSNGSYKLQVNSQIFATSATIATSDGRYKKDIQSLDGALGLVNQLNPVQFSWKQHPVHAFDTSTPTIGFIAQEVQQVLADKPYLSSIIKSNKCVIKPEEKDDDGNMTKEAVTEEFLGIAEGNMIALLTKAIQEQQALIVQLQADVAALKGAQA